MPEIYHLLGSIISLLERHLIAKPFEVADSASLDGIMVSLFKVGASKLLIRFFLLEDVIDNDQNTMRDRNERLLLANAFAEPAILFSQVGAFTAGSSMGGFDEGRSEPLAAFARFATQALARTYFIARTVG